MHRETLKKSDIILCISGSIVDSESIYEGLGNPGQVRVVLESLLQLDEDGDDGFGYCILFHKWIYYVGMFLLLKAMM